MTGLGELERLRSNRIKAGFVVAMVSRVVKFGSTLVITGAIIRQLGDVAFGVLALAGSTFDLVAAFDLAIHELVAFELASTDTRAEAEHRLSQALLTAIIPGVAGGAVLLGLGVLAHAEIAQATVGHGGELRTLLLIFALTYPLHLISCVSAGTLHGFGYVRELNLVLVAGIVFDIVVVLVGLQAGVGLVTLQWLRAAGAVVRVVLLFVTARRFGLPGWSLRAPHWPSIKRMVRFGLGYSGSKGLGLVEYSCDIPVAQAFVGPAALAGYAAADQWANKLYRFSHVVFESLFPRFVRSFRAEASGAERANGASLYMAANVFVVATVVPAGVALTVLAPWVFQLWLGQGKGLGIDLLPWLCASWALNAAGSPSSCLILATGRFRSTIIAHAIAVVLNLVGDVVLGWNYGMYGIVIATTVANLVLTALLARGACELSDTPASALARWLLPTLLVGAGCTFAGRWWSASLTLLHALALVAVVAAVCGLLTWRSPHVRRAWALMRTTPPEPVSLAQ